jgi:hypothetical protein
MPTAWVCRTSFLSSAVEYVLPRESEQLHAVPADESNDTAATIKDPAVFADGKACDNEVPLLLPLVTAADCRCVIAAAKRG